MEKNRNQPGLVNVENTLLVIVDVQEKLTPLMSHTQSLVKNLKILIEGFGLLDCPVFYLEQYPRGLGPTTSELIPLLKEEFRFEKTSFSGCGGEGFLKALRKENRVNVVLAGIESHVCVFQTCRDLILNRFNLFLCADAIDSRTQENRKIGLERGVQAGGLVTTTEMILFELMKESTSPQFKKISSLLR